MTKPDYRAMCAELAGELEDWIDGYLINDPSDIHTDAAYKMIERARALLDQPEPPELTDQEIDALERQCWIPTEACNDAGCEYYASLRRFARAAIAADRARRATPQPEEVQP